jgi:hypothetical protein
MLSPLSLSSCDSAEMWLFHRSIGGPPPVTGMMGSLGMTAVPRVNSM